MVILSPHLAHLRIFCHKTCLARSLSGRTVTRLQDDLAGQLLISLRIQIVIMFYICFLTCGRSIYPGCAAVQSSALF